MKLLPFTKECRQKLLQDGFTHVHLVRCVKATDREFETSSDYYLFEAMKPGDEKLQNAYEGLMSDSVTDCISCTASDCYILVRK